MSLSRNDFRRSVPIGGRLEALEVIEVEGNAGRRTKFDRIFVLTFVTFSFYCIRGKGDAAAFFCRAVPRPASQPL